VEEEIKSEEDPVAEVIQEKKKIKLHRRSQSDQLERPDTSQNNNDKN
jgi:hypothetical protein